MLRFSLTSPLYVPFRTVRTYDSEASILQSIDNRVVNVSSLRYFETEHHIMLLEVLLASNLHLLEGAE